eukprot:7201110-Prymnesium_polylepis.2
MQQLWSGDSDGPHSVNMLSDATSRVCKMQAQIMNLSVPSPIATHPGGLTPPHATDASVRLTLTTPRRAPSALHDAWGRR